MGGQEKGWRSGAWEEGRGTTVEVPFSGSDNDTACVRAAAHVCIPPFGAASPPPLSHSGLLTTAAPVLPTGHKSCVALLLDEGAHIEQRNVVGGWGRGGWGAAGRGHARRCVCRGGGLAVRGWRIGVITSLPTSSGKRGIAYLLWCGACDVQCTPRPSTTRHAAHAGYRPFTFPADEGDAAHSRRPQRPPAHGKPSACSAQSATRAVPPAPMPSPALCARASMDAIRC